MNRKNSIEFILSNYKPDIITLQELNITEDDDLNLCQIAGYKLEVDQLLQQNGRARAGIYIKDSINYERMKELEVKDEPVIWLKIKLPGNKIILLQNYYRQWRMLNKEGHGIPNTETTKSQKVRFQKVADVWSQQMQTNEVISLSDTNINLNKNFNSPNLLNDSDRKTIPLFRILQDKIFNMGATVINTKPTKIYEDKPNSFIDHLITNYPQKILHHKVLDHAISDHLMVIFTI